MAEITEILSGIQNGDERAANRLLPLIYDELRMLAAARLRQERAGQTLDATSLVHEAYIRLVNPNGSVVDTDQGYCWTSHAHFFAAAAEAMRRILVENARRKNSLRRGGLLKRKNLDDCNVVASDTPDYVLEVSEALDQLLQIDYEAGSLVKLRYFGGLSIPDAAKVLGISPRSADRIWVYARSWIRRALEDRYGEFI